MFYQCIFVELAPKFELGKFERENRFNRGYNKFASSYFCLDFHSKMTKIYSQ